MKPGSPAQRLLNQWDLKVLALLAASLLAVYVRFADPIETRILPLTLRPLNLPADYIIADADQLKITAVLEGPASALHAMSADSVVAFVRFGEVKDEGTYTLPVMIGELPAGVEIRDYPKQAPLTVAHFREQTFPVEMVFLGAAPEGMQTTTPSLQPSVVNVKGPVREVDRIHRVVCYLRFADIVKNPAQIVPVAALDAGNQPVQNVTLMPDKVSVSISASFAAIAKVVPVKPQLTGNPAPGYLVNALHAEPQVVLVQGRPDALSNLESIETAPIDLTGAQQDLTLQNLSLQYDARQVTVTPPTVDLTVEVRAATGTARYVVPVTVNYRGGGTATASPAQVLVTLSGPMPALQKALASQIEVTVRLSPSATGSYAYPVKVKAPAGLEVVSADPPEVTVEVRH